MVARIGRQVLCKVVVITWTVSTFLELERVIVLNASSSQDPLFSDRSYEITLDGQHIEFVFFFI